MEETREFVALFSRHHLPFRASVALQLDFGCSNVDLNYDEIGEALDITGELTDRYRVPVFVNFNVVADLKVMIKTANQDYCVGLWIANTIPWGYPRIDWKAIFGTDESPMISRGLDSPGGLPGPECLPFAELRVKQMRAASIIKLIVVGNGIQKPQDVIRLRDAGADAVAVGSVALVRPWRLRAIIKAAHHPHDWRQIKQ